MKPSMFFCFCFQVEKDGYSSSLSLTREQFCDAMLVLLQKGSQEEVDFLMVQMAPTLSWNAFKLTLFFVSCF